MLAADKDRLIANAKQTALQLRHKELDYYIDRYSNLATQSSILAGFAFDGLVELENFDGNGHWKWVDSVFYTAGSLTMAFSLGKVRMVDAMARLPAPIATSDSSPKRSWMDDCESPKE